MSVPPIGAPEHLGKWIFPIYLILMNLRVNGNMASGCRLRPLWVSEASRTYITVISVRVTVILLREQWAQREGPQLPLGNTCADPPVAAPPPRPHPDFSQASPARKGLCDQLSPPAHLPILRPTLPYNTT